MPLGKPQRQHRIARLLEEQVISSQVQLVELLATEGLILTQGTVSRDLEELGAVKVRIPGGQMAYAIPELPKDRVTPGGLSEAGAGRVPGRGGPFGQPGRPADAAGFGPRGRFGPRPGRPARTSSAPSPVTTPSWSSARPPTGGRSCPPAWPGSPGSKRNNQRSSSGSTSRPGVFGWARHVGRRPVDGRGVGMRGHRPGGRCRSGRRLRDHPQAGPVGRGRRSRGDRRPGPLRIGLRGSRRAGQRPLRGPLPAGVGAVPAGHRRGARGRRPPSRRHRRGPRLHRQGQRPGPLRGLHPGAGPRPRRHGPDPGLGLQP